MPKLSFHSDTTAPVAGLRVPKANVGIIAVCAALAAGWAGPAYCQTIQQRQEERGQKVEKTPMQQIQEERAQRRREVEKEYEAAMKRAAGAPTPKVVVDPWGGVRSAAPGPDKK